MDPEPEEFDDLPARKDFDNFCDNFYDDEDFDDYEYYDEDDWFDDWED
jgi:hypothetical protein